MSFYKRFAIPLNLLVIAVTIVFVAMALVVGRAEGAPVVTLTVGDPSPQDYQATRTVTVDNEAATAREKELARIQVPTQYKIDPAVKTNVRGAISGFFSNLRDLSTLTEEEAGLAAAGTGGEHPTSTTSVEPTSTTPSSAEPVPGTEITTTTVAPTTTTTVLPRRPIDDWVAKLQALYPGLSKDTITAFVTLYNDDLDRIANGEPSLFANIENAADDEVVGLLDSGIKIGDLEDLRLRYLSDNNPVFVPNLDREQRALARSAIGELIARELLPNESEDKTAKAAAQIEAENQVTTVTSTFPAFALIAREGDPLTQPQIDAINELGLIEQEHVASRTGIAVLGALTVMLAAFFLWRLAPGQWSEPKHFALLGILLVLAALVSRMPELVNVADGETNQVAFAIPAMLFGYVAAILYDPRTAVLMSVPVATFVAISTGDPALTVFAAAATVAPVAFVSAVSSRRQLRVAVASSALVLVPLGAAIAWVFRGADTVREAALFSLVGGIVAGLIAQGLVSFLESLFRMTTTLTLLDLVDRNHPALRLIEEKAPGTFNHSILVGTLAGKAARAIGASPLLAQAAAFYHDLGKTEDPQYFIENQFGVSNPHDELDPAESAEIIRAHVIDGLRLARRYRLPPEVSAGIRMHHGTGLMRYFYHKALEADPDIDPQQFRHHGEKPHRREMAILMICDAVEGAVRSHAQEQDPTAESIKKLVDTVVGEKLDDGQLDESDLTFWDLTRVKAAIVEALIGYYHTRVPYPGFPGPRVDPD